MTETKDYWDRPSERSDPDFCANMYAILYDMTKKTILSDRENVSFFYELGYTKQCDHVIDFSRHRNEIGHVLNESTLQKIQKRDYDIVYNERGNLDFAFAHIRNVLHSDTRWNRFSLFLKIKSLFSFHKK